MAEELVQGERLREQDVPDLAQQRLAANPTAAALLEGLGEGLDLLEDLLDPDLVLRQHDALPEDLGHDLEASESGVADGHGAIGGDSAVLLRIDRELDLLALRAFEHALDEGAQRLEEPRLL